MKKGLEEKGGELLVNTTYVHNLMARYNEIKSDYERAYKDVREEFTFTNMVTPRHSSCRIRRLIRCGG
ncbi:MAG: hypothetical protein U5L09_23210 [Bacteroidales bacterium]|nr:hypothetical protein [Bacteroidales bacterium]